jgi:hypothetical protein
MLWQQRNVKTTIPILSVDACNATITVHDLGVLDERISEEDKLLKTVEQREFTSSSRRATVP